MELENKVSEQINDIKKENLEKLAQLFPSIIKDGQVDFKALKGEFEEVKEERYEFTWAGKQNAKKKVQEDVGARTLKYIEEDSKNPNTTENLYIEGDNLEVLKLLRQNYYGSIKMIYIDPPYNTGEDFIYNDNFRMSDKENAEKERYINNDNEKLEKNQSTGNKYHAKWLDMMYPRLKVARDLLAEDGLIFISIDDNEIENLKKICNEVFREENYINIISLFTKVSAGASGGGEDKRLKKNMEYILVYSKNLKSLGSLPDIYKKTQLQDYIQQMKTSGKSFKYINVLYNYGNIEYFKTIKDGAGEDIIIKKVNNYEIKTIKQIAKLENISEEEVYNKYFERIMTTTNAQTSIRERVWEATDNENNLYIATYKPVSGKNKGKEIDLFFMGKQKVLVIWLKDTAEKINNKIYKKEKIGTFWEGFSWINVSKEGNIKFENGKKPIGLVQQIIKLINNNSDITILDFFSGSATTAHAVMQLNAEDGGNRKYIMVQLNELTYDGKKEKYIDENGEEKERYIIDKETGYPIVAKDSEARKEGFYTICEIGKERIRRAGELIKKEIEESNRQLQLGEEPKKVPDIGFKVFRTADTNINWKKIREVSKDNVMKFDDPDMLDFTLGFNDKDVVYEVLLRQRDLPLSEKLVTLTDIGSRTYLYADSYLVCLETNVTEELIEKLAELNPLPIKFIFRDSAFGSKIGLKEETFRKLKTLVEKNSGLTKKAYTVEFI